MIRQFTIDHALFILAAARWTLILSLIAFVGGTIIGLLVAVAAVARQKLLRWGARAYIEFFQGTPLLMQIFTVYFGLPLFGVTVDAWTAVSISLTLNASAFLGEIWRGCINAVPNAQMEAALALGLRRGLAMRLVIIPQALKIAVAPTVGFMVQIVKGTSLAAIVNFVELMRAGQMVNNVTFRPELAYGLVVCLYFVLCFPLSAASRALEKRLGAAHVRVESSV
jgi:polar amino acid transport system permease protein